MRSVATTEAENALVESARDAADQIDLDADRHVHAQMVASRRLLQSFSGQAADTRAYRQNPKAQSLDSSVDYIGFGESLQDRRLGVSSASCSHESQAHRLDLQNEVEAHDTDSNDESSTHSSCLDEAVLTE